MLWVPAGAGALSQSPMAPCAASQEKGTLKAWNCHEEQRRLDPSLPCPEQPHPSQSLQNRLEKGHRMSSCSLQDFLSYQTGRGREGHRIPDIKCRIGSRRPLSCSSLHDRLLWRAVLKPFKWATPLTDQGSALKFPFLLSQTALACTDCAVTLTFRWNCCQRDGCWSHLFPRLKLGLNWWNEAKMGNCSKEVQGIKREPFRESQVLCKEL